MRLIGLYSGVGQEVNENTIDRAFIRFKKRFPKRVPIASFSVCSRRGCDPRLPRLPLATSTTHWALAVRQMLPTKRAALGTATLREMVPAKMAALWACARPAA